MTPSVRCQSWMSHPECYARLPKGHFCPHWHWMLALDANVLQSHPLWTYVLGRLSWFVSRRQRLNRDAERRQMGKESEREGWPEWSVCQDDILMTEHRKIVKSRDLAWETACLLCSCDDAPTTLAFPSGGAENMRVNAVGFQCYSRKQIWLQLIKIQDLVFPYILKCCCESEGGEKCQTCIRLKSNSQVDCGELCLYM